MLPSQTIPSLNNSINLDNKISYFNLPNFELRIIRTPPQIVIQAQNWETSKFYLVTLDAESVKEFRSFIFDTVADLHLSLLGGLDGTHKDIKFEIDDAAKIKLIWEGQVASTVKKNIIEIQLKEQEPSPLEDIERCLAKLEENKNQSEDYRDRHFIKMFESVAMFMRNQAQSDMQSSIEKMAKRIDKMEESNQKLAAELTDKINKLEQNQKKLANVDELRNEIKKIEDNVIKLKETNKKADEAKLENMDRILEDLQRRIDKIETSALEVKDIEQKEDKFEKIIEEIEQRTNSMIENQAEMFNKVLSDIGERVSEVHCKYASLEKKIQQHVNKKDGSQSQEAEMCIAKIQKSEKDVESNHLDCLHKFKLIEEHSKETADLINAFKARSIAHFKANTAMILSVERKTKTAMDTPGLFQKMETKFKAEYPEDLIYENSDKVVRSKPEGAVNQAIFCDNPLPKSGKYYVSWKIEDVNLQEGKSILLFGIGARILKETKDIKEEGNYFFNPFSNLAYLNGHETERDAEPTKVGDVIHVLVDRDTKTVYFKINGNLCYDAAFDEANFYGALVYPCLFYENCSDLKLSLV